MTVGRRRRSGAGARQGRPQPPVAPPAPTATRKSALKQKAMADTGVQAMLDVFRTDIKEVEEI